MTTRADVAKLAGVSPATVTLALNRADKISKPVQQRVLEAAAALNYTPNRIAQRLASRKFKNIGIVANSIVNFGISEIITAFEVESRKNGYMSSLILATAEIDNYISVILSRQLDGVFISTVEYDFNQAQLATLRNNGIKIVTGDLFFDGVSSVCSDFSSGMRILFRELTALGHKRIGFISNLQLYSNNNVRYAAYRQCVDEFSCFFKKSYVYEDVKNVADDFQTGYCGAKKLLEESDVTAIITLNDMMAAGVIRAAGELGLSIPGDLSVCAADGSSFCDKYYPPITSVYVEKTELGKKLFGLLKESLDGKDFTREMMEMQYHKGESIGPVRERNNENI